MDMGLFIVILFLIAALMRVDFFFYILYVFFAVYLLSRFWAQRALRQVRVERKMPTHAFWGERVPVHLEVSNDGLLPVAWLQMQESLPQPLAYPPVRSQALSLWPHEKSTFSYELDCRKRGYYTIGPLRLSSGDLLAADGRTSAEGGIAHLTVYPRILPLADLGVPSRSPYGNIKRSTAIHRDPTRVAGVRDYQPGDSIRHVNWKTSAALGKLQSKVFDPVISLDTAIFLDLQRQHYEASHAVITTELAVSVAASVVSHLARQRQPFALASNGSDPLAAEGARGPTLPMRSGRAHLMSVLEVLGRIDTREVETFSSLVQRVTLNLPWGCSVLMVSGTGDDLLGHVLRLRRAGFAVAVILVDYHVDLRRRGEQLEHAGAAVYRVGQTGDLARMVV